LPDTNKPTFTEDARKRQLTEIAVEVIAELGYQQTTLAEIAKRAGITKGAIHYYFSSKQDLIQATIRWVSERAHAYFVPRVAICNTAAEKLHTFITASFEYMQHNRSYHVALVDLWGSYKTQEEKKALHENEYRYDRRWLEGIILEGRKQGELKCDSPDSLATLILAMVDGVMVQWVFDETSVDLKRCCQQALYALDHFLQT
jgi:AcrR family transcriptional regulator